MKDFQLSFRECDNVISLKKQLHNFLFNYFDITDFLHLESTSWSAP